VVLTGGAAGPRRPSTRERGYVANCGAGQPETQPEATRLHFDDDQLSHVTLFEHIETPFVDGAYVRVAVDQRA
jgi:hypothetical protein